MSPKENDVQVRGSFTISAQEASLTEARVRKLLAKATADAAKQARKDGYKVETESGLEGGILGVGETVAVLVMVAKSATAAKMAAAAAAGAKAVAAKVAEGGATAAGGYFFHKYLEPRLRKMNLMPGAFRSSEKKTAGAAPKKSPAQDKSKKKARGGERD